LSWVDTGWGSGVDSARVSAFVMSLLVGAHCFAGCAREGADAPHWKGAGGHPGGTW
jgi:hypothetical protein